MAGNPTTGKNEVLYYVKGVMGTEDIEEIFKEGGFVLGTARPNEPRKVRDALKLVLLDVSEVFDKCPSWKASSMEIRLCAYASACVGATIVKFREFWPTMDPSAESFLQTAMLSSILTLVVHSPSQDAAKVVMANADAYSDTDLRIEEASDAAYKVIEDSCSQSLLHNRMVLPSYASDKSLKTAATVIANAKVSLWRTRYLLPEKLINHGGFPAGEVAKTLKKHQLLDLFNNESGYAALHAVLHHPASVLSLMPILRKWCELNPSAKLTMKELYLPSFFPVEQTECGVTYYKSPTFQDALDQTDVFTNIVYPIMPDISHVSPDGVLVADHFSKISTAETIARSMESDNIISVLEPELEEMCYQAAAFSRTFNRNPWLFGKQNVLYIEGSVQEPPRDFTPVWGIFAWYVKKRMIGRPEQKRMTWKNCSLPCPNEFVDAVDACNSPNSAVRLALLKSRIASNRIFTVQYNRLLDYAYLMMKDRNTWTQKEAAFVREYEASRPSTIDKENGEGPSSSTSAKRGCTSDTPVPPKRAAHDGMVADAAPDVESMDKESSEC